MLFFHEDGLKDELNVYLPVMEEYQIMVSRFVGICYQSFELNLVFLSTPKAFSFMDAVDKQINNKP
ncbi:hypothetical protein CJZ70_09640 [Bacillus subtilis]|nr:hypothetical protein CJZ70_09640 [Bacillus subtilis]